jgi:hypothetical protein
MNTLDSNFSVASPTPVSGSSHQPPLIGQQTQQCAARLSSNFAARFAP